MKDRIFVVTLLLAALIGGCTVNNEKTENDNVSLFTGDGYSIYIPDNEFRKGKDYDDGVPEDYWESKTNEDVEIHVAKYSGVSSDTAQKHFLQENDDYIFEDLIGMPFCGREMDGDTLWFFVAANENDTYIVSWEYPAALEDTFSSKLAGIADTFQVE